MHDRKKIQIYFFIVHHEPQKKCSESENQSIIFGSELRWFELSFRSELQCKIVNFPLQLIEVFYVWILKSPNVFDVSFDQILKTILQIVCFLFGNVKKRCVTQRHFFRSRKFSTSATKIFRFVKSSLFKPINQFWISILS